MLSLAMVLLVASPPDAPRSGDRVAARDPYAACTVQAIGIETFRKNGSQTTRSTDFHAGDAEIHMERRYPSSCAPSNPAMPVDIGFQLDGTTFHVSSSADSRNVSDNSVQHPVVFRPKPPEPLPPSEAGPPETVRAPARVGGGGATGEEDQRAQLIEERQRAQDYLARLRRTPRGGDRPPPYEPRFPGIERPVRLTSIPEMENYLGMVDGRLAMVNERAAQRASQAGGAQTPGAAERTTAPVPPAASPPPPGSVVATPNANLFGVRVPIVSPTWTPTCGPRSSTVVYRRLRGWKRTPAGVVRSWSSTAAWRGSHRARS